MKGLGFKRLVLVFILFLIFNITLFAVDFNFTGKWDVYSFSNRWIYTEKSFLENIDKLDRLLLLPDERWEFNSENYYRAESRNNITYHTATWEMTDYDNIYNSTILFFSENEFYIITRHKESNGPFGLISYKMFVRQNLIKNADNVDIPILTFIALPQAPGVRNYFSKIPVTDIDSINTSPDDSIVNPPKDNASSYNIPVIDVENEAVDPFLDEFYYHLNVYREKYNRVSLARDTRLEKIAEKYSAILAKNGFISHNALSDFEFEILCYNHELEYVFLREILVSYPNGRTPLEVLSYYQASPTHNAALLERKGEGLGVGYVKSNGMIFFTAYIEVPE